MPRLARQFHQSLPRLAIYQIASSLLATKLYTCPVAASACRCCSFAGSDNVATFGYTASIAERRVLLKAVFFFWQPYRLVSGELLIECRFFFPLF
jgi:hypothetical protein